MSVIEKGEELKEIGVDRLCKFIESQRGKKVTDKETMEQLINTIAFAKICEKVKR